MRKGPAVTDESAGDSAPSPDNGATTKMPGPPPTTSSPTSPSTPRRPGRHGRRRGRAGRPGTMPVSTVPPPTSGRPPGRLRRRSHPRRAALRRAARTAHRDGNVGRGRAPHSRRHHRRRPLPAAGLPRRTAEPAVLAGARHGAGSPGRADVRRPRRGAVRRASSQEILDRTLRLSRIERPGVARVLDVANTGSGGLVVSASGSAAVPCRRWPRRRRPRSGAPARCRRWPPPPRRPIGPGWRCRSTTPAGSGSASRVTWRWRSPRPLPDATPEDDIRGIGAALYALLVNRWPLPESGVRSGLAPAERRRRRASPSSRGRSTATIPFQISAAAARSVQDGGGIRSAPTLLNLLQQATAVADRTELIAPVDEPEAPPRPPRSAARARRTRGGGPPAQGADRRAERRRPRSSSSR